MAPAIAKLTETDGVEVKKIDAHDFPEEAADFGISSVPTLVLIEDGREKDRHVGALTLQELRAFAGV
jgi:thioredoxin-like negative regulator of GroEL